MFSLARPAAAFIERFIADSEHLPVSYAEAGMTQHPYGNRAVYDIDELVTVIGRGADDFEAACAALEQWTQFNVGWVEQFPAAARIVVGTHVAVLARHLGLWSLSGARIVYVAGDRRGGRHFGFAYGTLTNHVECGEELFEVTLDAKTAEVRYRIRAMSRPRAPLARAGYPIARMLQARFRRDSEAAMQRAVARAHQTSPLR